MSFFGFFHKIESKVPFSFISWLITLISVAITIFIYYYGQEASISSEIVTSSNVIDVHKPIKNLEIIFQGKNIQKEDFNLKIIAIRLENNGRINILPSYYDPAEMWGIKISGGQPIEVRITKSSSEYINNHINPAITTQHFIKLNKIIFDAGQYFIVEALVIHKKGDVPKVELIGKIAGIDRINTIQQQEVQGEKSFIGSVFEGHILIQAVRVFAYFWIGFLVLLVISLITKIWTTVRVKKKRESLIQKIQNLFIDSDPKLANDLKDIYIKGGLDRLQTMRQALNALRDGGAEAIRFYSMAVKDINQITELTEFPKEIAIPLLNFLPAVKIMDVSLFVLKHAVIKDTDKLRIDINVLELVNHFTQRLEGLES